MLRGVRPELYRATATRHGPPVSGWRLRWSVDVLLATGLWFDRSSLAELFHAGREGPRGKAGRPSPRWRRTPGGGPIAIAQDASRTHEGLNHAFVRVLHIRSGCPVREVDLLPSGLVAAGRRGDAVVPEAGPRTGPARRRRRTPQRGGPLRTRRRGNVRTRAGRGGRGRAGVGRLPARRPGAGHAPAARRTPAPARRDRRGPGGRGTPAQAGRVGAGRMPAGHQPGDRRALPGADASRVPGPVPPAVRGTQAG